MGSLLKKGKKRKTDATTARPIATATTPSPKLPPLTIREPSPPRLSPEPISADPHGKRPMISSEEPPSKKARTQGIPLVPPFPAAKDFNPFAVLEEIWSPEAIAERDQFIEASRKEERDPSIAAGKYLLAAAQNLQAAYVSRLDILAERDTVIADLAATKKQLSTAEVDIDLLKASKESLQLSLDQAQEKNQELEKESAVLVTKVGELQDELKNQEVTAKEAASAATREWRWTFKRFGYQCFKNAVAQLKVKNPHIDTSSICPNKEVFDGVIRDRQASDPEDAAFPPVPENFEQEDYDSPGDDEFPYFEDPLSPDGNGSVPGGEVAEEIGGSPAAAEKGDDGIEVISETSAASE